MASATIKADIRLRTGRSVSGIPQQAGLTLLELLITLVLTMVLIVGAMSSYLGSKKTYSFVDEMSRMQEQARFLNHQLNQDVRQAGDVGCPSGPLRNFNQPSNGISMDYVSTLRRSGATADNWMSYFPRGVEGYTGADASASGAFLENKDAEVTSDVLVVHRINADAQIGVSSHSIASVALTTTAAHGFTAGNPLMLVAGNCRNMAVFVMSGPSSSATTSINYASGGSTSYVNCAAGLQGSSVNCAPAPTNSALATTAGAYITPLATTAYFVRDDQHLMRLRAGSTSAESLMSGVENMELMFGVDSDGDGVANRFYRPADMLEANWVNVMTVHVNLVLTSDIELLSNAEDFSCGSYSESSKLMRRCFSSTINIRNRGGQNI